MTTKINFYEKRDFGEKINTTFAFLRQNFKPLGKSLLYIAGPLILLLGIYTGLFPMDSIFSSPGGNIPGSFLLNVGGTLLLSTLVAVLVTAIVYGYIKLYHQADDHPKISVSDVWEAVKRDYLKLLVATIVVSIVVTIGFILLFIPGIILGTALSLIFVILVIEQRSLGDAFKRCFSLVSDNYLSTLGLIIVVIMLQMLIGFIFALPSGILAGVSAYFVASGDASPQDSSVLYQLLFIIAQIISTLGSQLLSAITLVAIAFQYANLVEKKEAAGLMQNINTIGESKPVDRDEETY